MTIIWEILVFMLGLCLSVQVVGALFSLIDLWSDLRRSWPVTARAILFWGGLASILTLILGPYRPAFLWGMAAFAFLHIAFFYGNQRLFIRNRRLLEKEFRESNT